MLKDSTVSHIHLDRERIRQVIMDTLRNHAEVGKFGESVIVIEESKVTMLYALAGTFNNWPWQPTVRLTIDKVVGCISEISGGSPANTAILNDTLAELYGEEVDVVYAISRGAKFLAIRDGVYDVIFIKDASVVFEGN